MNRETLHLIGYGALLIMVLALVIVVLGNLLGLAVMVAIGCGIGLLSESIYPSPFNNGRLSATAIGLTGALVGNAIFGKWGPSLAHVYFIPALIGALIVSAILRAKVRYDRLRHLEDLKASAGEEPLAMSMVEQYRLIRFVGAGGFAKVFQGVPDRTLRESDSVAVKVFSESAIEQADFVARIDREVALCQKLEHPNIVKIHKSAEQNKLRYIVMEFVKGETLRNRLKKGRMEIPEAVNLLIELAGALAHAHSHGVIHRDVKPDNIILTPHGSKIMDFGLARQAGTSDLTQTGSAIGTPHYMPPEQILGEKQLDGRCDQYALGAMGFEILTGEKLFDGEEAIHVVVKHVQDEPRNPREIRPQISEALANCILKMIAKDRNDRYPDMDAVVADLQTLKPEAIALARPVGT
ncbi:MAG: protein kinase [Vulcanimicrobiota bacterium]